MTSLLSKKLTYMEGGYMLNSSGLLIQVLMLMGGLFALMLSFYIVLCFIQWVSDVIDEKRWMIWKEFFNYDN